MFQSVVVVVDIVCVDIDVAGQEYSQLINRTRFSAAPRGLLL